MSASTPLIVINAVGMTRRLLPLARRLHGAGRSRLGARASGSRPRRDLHGAGDLVDRTAARWSRNRRQRLVLPRHRRGPVLAAIQCLDPGGAALRYRPTPGRRTGPRVPGRQALLVVQPGGGRRLERHAQTVLRGGWEQGVRDRRNARWADRRPGTPAWAISVSHLLGTGGRAAVYAVDCPLRRDDARNATARPDPRVPAAPRLRPPTIRAVRLRHAPAGRRVGRRLRPVAGDRPAGRRAVWVVSEYGHCDVRRPVPLNRVLRRDGFLSVRPGPFGEVFDTFNSRAFAVCDHQVAHLYVNDPSAMNAVRALIAEQPGVARVVSGGGTRRGWPRPSPLGRTRRPGGFRRLVRLSLLARRRPGARLRPDGRYPPQTGL